MFINLKTAFVVFRECIEISIMLSAIYKVFSKKAGFSTNYQRGILFGALLAVLTCSLISYFFMKYDSTFFSFFIVTVSALMMFWAVITMSVSAGGDTQSVKASIFYVSCITLFREVSETMLFVIGASINDSWSVILLSIFAGLIPGGILGGLSYFAIIRLDHPVVLRLLHFFLAGITANLFAESSRMIYAYFNISVFNFEFYNFEWLIKQNSIIGEILESFFGYSAEPMLYEFIVFWGVIIFIYILRRFI